MAFFAFLCGIAFVFLMFGLGSLFGYTILRPVIRGSHGRKVSTRLYTVDFFSLTMVLVLPTMLVTTFPRSGFSFEFAAVAGVLVYAITLWVWGRGAVKLSSIGVDSSLKRFVFLGLVLPLTILGTGIGVPLLLIGIASSVPRPETGPSTLLLFTGLLGAIPVALLGRKICHWIIRLEKPED